MCDTHPRYRAMRRPRVNCGQCWFEYFKKNPEAKVVIQKLHDASQDASDKKDR